MSSVFVGPNQCGSHTSSMMRPRGTAAPFSFTRSDSRSNSLGVSSSSRSPSQARRARTSMRTCAALEQRLVALAGGPAQQGPDPGQQLGQPEGLRHVVVRAGVEADDRVDLLGARREHEDQLLGAHLADLAAHLEAFDVREAEVQHQQVEALVRGPLDPLPALRGSDDVVALPTEHPLERGADVLVILHQQHPGHRLERKPAPSGGSGHRIPLSARNPLTGTAGAGRGSDCRGRRGRWGGRAPDDQRRVDGEIDRRRAGPVDALQQRGDRLAPHLGAGLVDRGEPDVVHRGEAGVVVPDEGDVLGHPQPLAAEAVERPGRAEVVGGEDGRRQVVAADEAGDGAHARQLGQVAADDAHVAVEAVTGHRDAVAGAAGCAACAATAVDVDDALVAEAGEVVDRQAGARLLVVVDGVDDRGPQAAADGHERHGPRRGLDRGAGQPGADEDDPVDRAAPETPPARGTRSPAAPGRC